MTAYVGSDQIYDLDSMEVKTGLIIGGNSESGQIRSAKQIKAKFVIAFEPYPT